MNSAEIRCVVSLETLKILNIKSKCYLDKKCFRISIAIIAVFQHREIPPTEEY